jgi:hypothetical protein
MNIMHMLSSGKVMERRAAIRLMKEQMREGKGFLALLSLRYVSEHDPCYTIRNVARQALYIGNAYPESKVLWDKAYLFRKG